MQGQAPWGPWAQGRDLPSPDLGRVMLPGCLLQTGVQGPPRILHVSVYPAQLPCAPGPGRIPG